MKRKIFLLALFLFVGLGSMQPVMATPSCNRQVKEKSEAEVFMKNLAKIKDNEINYAYISVAMFRQMLSEMLPGDSEAQKLFGSLRYMRQFMSIGTDGYMRLKKYMQPFLEGEEETMGLKLMVHNREGDGQSVVYSGTDVILVISDCSDDELRVVFIAGMGYDDFMENGIEGLDFGF